MLSNFNLKPHFIYQLSVNKLKQKKKKVNRIVNKIYNCPFSQWYFLITFLSPQRGALNKNHITKQFYFANVFPQCCQSSSMQSMCVCSHFQQSNCMLCWVKAWQVHVSLNFIIFGKFTVRHNRNLYHKPPIHTLSLFSTTKLLHIMFQMWCYTVVSRQSNLVGVSYYDWHNYLTTLICNQENTFVINR